MWLLETYCTNSTTSRKKYISSRTFVVMGSMERTHKIIYRARTQLVHKLKHHLKDEHSQK